MIKAVIFDWGRTIYDKENENIFAQTPAVLEYFSKKYKVVVVSLATDGDIETRFAKIEKYGLWKYLAFALFHKNDKDALFRNAFGNLRLNPEEILVVDDYMKRLEFPIKAGCKAIWIKKGKFADFLPNEETGKPNYIINNLSEILDLGF
ncbi:MAG: HAD family hydrolase [Candidatus Levybacteria bacterium]|nr:HAD family hydrolase [Candidatus Levybacteria bacterium]